MLAIAVWLAAANTFGILAILPSGAATAAATTAIGPTLLAGALRLADAAHAFAVLAALAFRAAAAGSAAAVITAGLAGAAGGARLAAAAALILYLADADVVPHGFAAEGIDGADTGLNARIAAARSFKGCTAVAAASALATVGGADLAVLAPLTLPVTASGAGVALATAEGGNLVDADFIPLHFAAERVLLADTIGHATIVAANDCGGEPLLWLHTQLLLLERQAYDRLNRLTHLEPCPVALNCCVLSPPHAGCQLSRKLRQHRGDADRS